MKSFMKVAGLATTLALMASPAFALPSQAPDNQGTAHAPSTPAGPPSNQGTERKPSTPGPNASLPAKAKAYGVYCQNQSKKHVKGEKGTPFSKCVTAMAKLASGQTKSPREACKDESKKHVKGEKGTPFSRCVSGGAKLLEDQRAQNQS
jgi:hypothetical protein